MRKKISIHPLHVYFTITCALLLVACTKNSGGGSNNGGGNNGSLTITSFSPLRPYFDDTVVITGTGFNPDKTKDTLSFYPQAMAKILSATSTQLILTLPPANEMQLGICNCETFTLSAAGQKNNDTGSMVFKQTLALDFVTDADYNYIFLGRPGDSLAFAGTGFTKHGVSISIDGVALIGLIIDSAAQCSASIRLPKTFFGENNNDTASAYKNVIISNADGKTAQKSLPFVLSPIMQVFDMEANQNIYSIAALNSSGGKISVKIHGRNLKSDASAELDNTSTVHLNNPLQVSGFPDSTVVQYGTAGLSIGSYQFSLWRNNTLYGTCFFQVNL